MPVRDGRSIGNPLSKLYAGLLQFQCILSLLCSESYAACDDQSCVKHIGPPPVGQPCAHRLRRDQRLYEFSDLASTLYAREADRLTLHGPVQDQSDSRHRRRSAPDRMANPAPRGTITAVIGRVRRVHQGWKSSSSSHRDTEATKLQDVYRITDAVYATWQSYS